MRIAVLHNAVATDAPPEDQDTLVQVEAVHAALIRLGHRPTPVSCTLDLASLRGQMLDLRPDRAFNLVESLDGIDSLLDVPPMLLDAMGIAYAGCSAEAIHATSNKPLAKRLLRSAGLPTPDWLESDDVPRPRESGDWIVKGIWEHGSDGLDDDALLWKTNEAELHGRLTERSARTGKRAFAERYVEGREFVVALLAGPDGAETLPPAEIDFSAFDDGKPHIVGYKAKWIENCFEFGNTPRRFDFPTSDRPLLEWLDQLAVECWRLFKLRGWARVDFRVDAAGRPWILEINANPCIAPDAGFAAMLERAAISYDQAIERILADV